MEKSEEPKAEVEGVPNAGVEGVPNAGVEGVPNAGVEEGVAKGDEDCGAPNIVGVSWRNPRFRDWGFLRGGLPPISL